MSVFFLHFQRKLGEQFTRKTIGLARPVTRLQPGHCFLTVGTRSEQCFFVLDTSVPYMCFSDAPFYHDKFNKENATKI